MKRTIDDILNQYAWIEYIENSECDSVEYTLWIDWLDGVPRAAKICVTPDGINFIGLEIDILIHQMIVYLEKEFKNEKN